MDKIFLIPKNCQITSSHPDFLRSNFFISFNSLQLLFYCLFSYSYFFTKYLHICFSALICAISTLFSSSKRLFFSTKYSNKFFIGKQQLLVGKLYRTHNDRLFLIKIKRYVILNTTHLDLSDRTFNHYCTD